MKYTWLKWYPSQWLHSTTRYQMPPEERSVFLDFVCLAAINSNPGEFKFLDAKSLARQLNVKEKIITKTIAKCIETKKIEISEYEDGFLCKIAKWHIYQTDSSKNVNIKEANKDLKLALNNTEERRGEENKKERYIERKEEPVSPERASLIETKEKSNRDKIQKIVDKWNEFAKREGLAGITIIKPGGVRYRRLVSRLGEKEFNFEQILEEIKASPFLKGDNNNGWRVTFDWIICPSNYPKILEGQYRGRGGGGRPAGVSDAVYSELIVGKNPNLDYPPGYWEKVAELKAKGFEGEKLMAELRKIPDFAEYYKRQKMEHENE